MTPFLAALTRYLQTSTSILGAAIATPAFGAAVSGQITWRDAALPLIGATVLLLAPQKASPPAAGVPVHAPVPASPLPQFEALVTQIGTIAAATKTPIGAEISAVLPSVADALEAAWKDYEEVTGRLAALKAQAADQAAVLTAAATATGSKPAPVLHAVIPVPDPSSSASVQALAAAAYSTIAGAANSYTPVPSLTGA